MRKQLRIAALLLASAIAVFSVASCSEKEKASAIPENYVKIAENGKTLYRVVRSDTDGTGSNAAADMKQAMELVAGKDNVTIMSDFEHKKLGTERIDTEILVGPTNREESSAHEREFTYFDYAIDFDTTRISITGGSSAALELAAEYFTNNFVFVDEKAVALPKGTVYEYKHDYPVDSITIGGKNIEDFVIVAYEGDSRANNLANSFNEIYGKRPKVVSPGYKEVSECEIVFSSANDERYTEKFEGMDDFEYMYRVEGTKVFVGTNGLFPDDDAVEMFIADCFDAASLKGSSEITLTDKNARSERLPSAEKHIMTDEKRAEIDAMADALKNEIMQSTNMAIPENVPVYYVSPNGNDGNDGKTPQTAWKSLEKVNAYEHPGKSYILFERGGIWRGQIKAKANTTYSAYGEGAKPALYGGPADGADPSKWTLMEGTTNIWIYADEMIDSGTIIFNHGEKHAYKEIPSYIDGGFKKRNAHEEEFDIIDALDVDLDFFHAADSVLTDNKYPTSGTAIGEIYLRCDAGNPGRVFESIEFVPRRNGFAVGGDNVTIDNFTVKYIGAHGVGAGTRTGLTVQNCEFGWIGGGIQSYAANGNTTQSATRFGNAIEIYGGCEDFDVHHNYIWQVYDAGITHQYKSESFVKQANVSYYSNLVENCVYSIEYFLNASDNPDQSMYNIKMYDNILRYAGCGWGNQRPDKSSPAHIKGWDHDNPAVDFEIYNNIMDRSANWMIHCGYKEKEWEPKIYGNTFIQYSDGLFGRYDLVPTRVIAYGNEMLSDERLFDNTFWFIEDENAKKFTGDRGTLALRYNGLPIYRDGDYIEIHGEAIKSRAETEKIAETLAKAESICAVLAGYDGKLGEGSIVIGDKVYEQMETYVSMADMKAAIAEVFDEALSENILKQADRFFIEKDGKLYRLGGFSAQFSSDSAGYTIEECYLGTDDTVSILVSITFDDMFKSECRTLYKAVKDENGNYKLTGAFALPVELAVAYPPAE